MQRLTPLWRKSSHSSGNGGECVETAAAPGAVLVRDTKNHATGPVLRITPANWRQFTASLKH